MYCYYYFSVALVPLVYEIVLELGGSYWCAVLGGMLVCFENMLVVQSRFILIDSPMLFFMAASIWCYVKVTFDSLVQNSTKMQSKYLTHSGPVSRIGFPDKILLVSQHSTNFLSTFIERLLINVRQRVAIYRIVVFCVKEKKLLLSLLLLLLL